MSAVGVETLQGMPVFGAIREDTLRFLLGIARERTVPAGGFFFREQDVAESMFVIERGTVTILKRWQGREVVVRRMGSGDCFGEIALLDLGHRSASVRADTDCVALELTAADLMQLFERDPEQFALIQMNIGREVCRRLRAATELLLQAAERGEPPGLSSVFGAH